MKSTSKKIGKCNICLKKKEIFTTLRIVNSKNQEERSVRLCKECWDVTKWVLF